MPLLQKRTGKYIDAQGFRTHSLPDGLSVCGILGEVFQQLHQCQMDAFLSGDVGATQQFMKSFPNVP